MDVAQIKSLLMEIMADDFVPDEYKEEVSMFLTLNTASEDLLIEAYELAQDLLEVNPREKLPASVSRFVVAKFKDEIKHDNDMAACALGILFLQKRCVDVDYTGAIRCFETAACLGSIRGSVLLSMCHCYGWGTAVDYQRAEELLCNTGNDALALLLQGKMLADEKTGKTDRAEAYFKFLECEKNMDAYDRELFGAELYYCLGDCYLEGYAGNRDNCEALKYYRLAEVQYYRRVFQGDTFVMERLGEVRRMAEKVEKLIWDEFSVN